MQYLQVRTTNGNVLGFEYGDKDRTRYQVTPEGCKVPKDVAVYADRVYPFVEIFKGAIAAQPEPEEVAIDEEVPTEDYGGTPPLDEPDGDSDL